MKIELHINDTTWGLYVDGVKTANGLNEGINLKPLRYAVHKVTGNRVMVWGDKVENPQHVSDKRKPRYLKDTSGWVIVEETPAEIAARVATTIAGHAFDLKRKEASRSVQERHAKIVAGGGGMVS